MPAAGGGRAIDLYRDNPFRVLSVPVTADAAAVRKRVHELRGTLAGEAEGAAARLAHPSLRLEHELYWFWLDEGPAALDRAASAGSDIALHDLAVLHHAAALEGPGPAPWAPALQAWARTWRADRFWARLRERAVALAGPGSADAAVGMLREELPGRVLSATAAGIASLLAAGRDADAAAGVMAIGTSGFPPDDVRRARSEPLVRLVLRVGDLLAASRADLASDASRLMETAAHLRALEPLSASAEGVLDQVAEHLRLLALRRASANGDLAAALALLEVAVVLATSGPMRRRAQAARAECEDAWRRAYGLVSAHARGLATAGQWPDAIAAARQAHRLARTPEMAGEWEQAIVYWSAPPVPPAAAPAPRSSGGRAVLVMVALATAILAALYGVNLLTSSPLPLRTRPGLVLASEPPPATLPPLLIASSAPPELPSPSPSDGRGGGQGGEVRSPG